MKQFYLALLLTPLLLALPAIGYAQEGYERSAILGMAEVDAVSSIKFTPDVVYVAVGTSERYDGVCDPPSIDVLDVTRESSNPEIAGAPNVASLRHLSDGRLRIIFNIYGYNRGTCTITISFSNGESGQITVRVLGPEEFEYSNVCIDGVYYNFDSETLTAEVVKVPQGSEPYKGKITIPSQLEWYGKKYAVTSVGEHAFASCDVTSVQLPTSLKEIKPYAFMQSNLTYVDILDAVESIGESAFKDCTSLESVYLGTGAKIGHEAFTGCSKLTRFYISDSIYTMFSENDGVIYDKNFNKLILVPYGKDSISIPATVISIGEGSFMCNKLIDNIVFPDNLETIEKYACAGCTSLEQVVIPDKVTAIGDFAFDDCPDISRISLGRHLTTIGDNTFGHSLDVSDIHAYSVLPPTIQETTFANYNARLFVPKGRIGSYANAPIWRNFNTIEEFDTTSSLTYIEIDDNADGTDVYNTQGILIRANSTATDIESLPSGLYIIDGKRVIVK